MGHWAIHTITIDTAGIYDDGCCTVPLANESALDELIYREWDTTEPEGDWFSPNTRPLITRHNGKLVTMAWWIKSGSANEASAFGMSQRISKALPDCGCHVVHTVWHTDNEQFEARVWIEGKQFESVSTWPIANCV